VPRAVVHGRGKYPMTAGLHDASGHEVLMMC
jgi:hypothetical protein